MRRDQLEHAIRIAGQIIGHNEVIAVGSQSILRSVSEDRLPAEGTMSIEDDIMPSPTASPVALPASSFIRMVMGQGRASMRACDPPDRTGLRKPEGAKSTRP